MVVINVTSLKESLWDRTIEIPGEIPGGILGLKTPIVNSGFIVYGLYLP